MYDLVCIDCLTEFEEIDLIDKACPNCDSTHLIGMMMYLKKVINSTSSIIHYTTVLFKKHTS